MGLSMCSRFLHHDHRIEQLCTRLVAVRDSDDLPLILSELQAAVDQAIERLRSPDSGNPSQLL